MIRVSIGAFVLEGRGEFGIVDFQSRDDATKEWVARSGVKPTVDTLIDRVLAESKGQKLTKPVLFQVSRRLQTLLYESFYGDDFVFHVRPCARRVVPDGRGGTTVVVIEL